METAADSMHQKFLGASLIIAPLLFGASTFFWQNGEYGVTGGTLLTLSMVFWIPAFYFLFSLLKEKMPYYYPIGLLFAIYGCCVGGVSFGFLGFFADIFNISHQIYIDTLAQYPLQANLLLFWSGPFFPLSLLVLSINLVRKNALGAWLGVLLGLGAIAFPISRIPRIEMIAHLADLLIATPMILLGYQIIKTKDEMGCQVNEQPDKSNISL
jgi:hypothetical protein